MHNKFIVRNMANYILSYSGMVTKKHIYIIKLQGICEYPPWSTIRITHLTLIKDESVIRFCSSRQDLSYIPGMVSKSEKTSYFTLLIRATGALLIYSNPFGKLNSPVWSIMTASKTFFFYAMKKIISWGVIYEIRTSRNMLDPFYFILIRKE